jgi:hypothetical protein
MATVLEECITEEQRSVVLFFSAQKDSMKRILIKKCVLFTVGSVYREKRFSLGGKRFADDEEFETEVRKWLRQQSKILLRCGFRNTGKAMGEVYQCWWRTCREINGSFPGFNITCLTFYTHL